MAVDRIELDGTVEHKGGQQFVSGRGLYGDGHTRIHRPEPHGFSSWPVKGGIGLLITQPGSRDDAVVLGGENPGLRPAGDLLTAGGTAIYDADGNIVSIVGATLRIVHATEVRIVAPKIVLDGMVYLGGEDADRPASAAGTIDTGGFADVSNPASKVLMK